jgi:diacylglycerol O-acyltransferase
MVGIAAGAHTTTEESRIARLRPFALMYLRFESRDWPAHFGGLATVDGRGLFDHRGSLPLATIAERLDRRVARVPALRRRLHVPGLLGGRPLWVDDADFRIERHLHIAEVASPGGDAELLATAADANGRLLDRRHPLWEIWFLTGLSDGRVGVLLKLHHAMADGMAAVGVMASLFDAEADAPDPLAVPWQPAPIPSARELRADNLATKGAAARQILRSLAHPRRAIAALRPVVLVARRGFGGGDARRTSLNRRVRAGRRIGILHLDRGLAKTAARPFGGTVNDVVLTLWAGGLRALLLGRGEDTSGLELALGQAVSVRRRSNSLEVDNQVGTVVLPLPVADGDPGARMERIVATTRRMKGQRRRPAAIAGALAGLAATPLGRYLFNHQRATHVLVTNVVGPRAPVYLLGYRVLDVLPIIQLMGNIGLTLCAFTYAGHISMVVTADAQAFPDLETLMQGMRRDWETISQVSPGPL